MVKTILITGATDGIGRETAKTLAKAGHHLLLHGRSPNKLEAVKEQLVSVGDGPTETYQADFSNLAEVAAMADAVAGDLGSLDVLINNAGIFKTSDARTGDGLDVRFAVNTVAPYLLTRKLLSALGASGRVVNLSSAAQAPVDLDALNGEGRLDDMNAYAQSKLALTMWSSALARELGDEGPSIIPVNPGSMLGSKMVKEGFGVAGGDLGVGADILCRAALSAEFDGASGRYFDNDQGRFAEPHPAGRDSAACDAVVRAIEDVLAKLAG